MLKSRTNFYLAVAIATCALLYFHLDSDPCNIKFSFETAVDQYRALYCGVTP